MTREEASFILANIDRRVCDDQLNEALDIAIHSLEQEPILDKIKGYINHIKNTGLGKKKSLEFIEKFIDGLKSESEDKE